MREGCNGNITGTNGCGVLGVYAAGDGNYIKILNDSYGHMASNNNFYNSDSIQQIVSKDDDEGNIYEPTESDANRLSSSRKVFSKYINNLALRVK